MTLKMVIHGDNGATFLNSIHDHFLVYVAIWIL